MVTAADQRRYAQVPEPLHFPVEEKVPETKRHLELRTALYQVLKLALGDRAAIGCDQFVYWDPTDPSACLAPDAFVRLGAENDLFDTWKVWERGAPHVAVELASRSDARIVAWDVKREKYRRLGVQELVRFDPDAPEHPLAVWDNLGGHLVRRELSDSRYAGSMLGFSWTVASQPELGPMLRPADRETGALLPTPAERATQEREREAREREREARERERALERVRALEQELARRK